LLARWADASQLPQLERIFVRLAESDKGSSGLTIWLKMTWYPLIYLMYAGGIAAVLAKNFAALFSILHAPVVTQRAYGDKVEPFAVAAIDGANGLSEYFNKLPGHERQYVPRSEYLYKGLQPVVEDLLMPGRGYDLAFDRFEVLLALEYADLTGGDWGPPGRFAWKHRHDRDTSPLRRLQEEAERDGDSWLPLHAGLFGRSRERFAKDFQDIEALLRKLPWL